MGLMFFIQPFLGTEVVSHKNLLAHSFVDNTTNNNNDNNDDNVCVENELDLV